jgi:hypothetical protein
MNAAWDTSYQVPPKNIPKHNKWIVCTSPFSGNIESAVCKYSPESSIFQEICVHTVDNITCKFYWFS